MTVAMPPLLGGLGRALVQQGRLQETEAERIAADAKPETGGFVGQLIASGRMGSRDIAVFAAQTFGYPLLDLNAFSSDHLAKEAIDRRVMQNHQTLALIRRGNRLSVAMADPTNLRALDEIRFQTGMIVDPVVVEADKLLARLAKVTEKADEALQNLIEDDLQFEFDEENADEAELDGSTSEVDDAPVVKFIQKILHDAIAEEHRTSTSSPMKSITGFASVSMAFCGKSPSRPWSSRRKSPRASR